MVQLIAATEVVNVVDALLTYSTVLATDIYESRSDTEILLFKRKSAVGHHLHFRCSNFPDTIQQPIECVCVTPHCNTCGDADYTHDTLSKHIVWLILKPSVTVDKNAKISYFLRHIKE